MNEILQAKLTNYLKEVELHCKPGTLREAKRILFAAQPFLNLDDPRSGALAFLMHRKGQGMHPRTLENERVRVGNFYRWMGVPKLGIPAFRFTEPKPVAYKQAETDTILSVSEGRNVWLFRTLLQAGLREQEAMYLEYRNLLDHGIEVAPHGTWTPKTSEERVVVVPRSLVLGLRLLAPVKGSPLVFPSSNGKLRYDMLRTLKRTAKRAGLNPDACWLHKFRATFATHLLRRGMDIREVARQMGHRNIETTMKYLALLDNESAQQKVEQVWS